MECSIRFCIGWRTTARCAVDGPNPIPAAGEDITPLNRKAARRCGNRGSSGVSSRQRWNNCGGRNMHRLEQQIADWRKNMTADRGIGRETLEELENHLREMIDEHLRRGLSESEAFQKAMAQVGSPLAISSEFGKLTHSMWWPVKVAIGLGLAAAVEIAILMVARFDGRSSGLLLATHVLTVTLGYLGTFLIGGVGICFVLQ